MRKKQRLLVFLCGVFLAMFLIPYLRQNQKRDKIIDFVLENQTELETLAQDYDDGDRAIDAYKGVQIDGVYNQIVQFTHSAFGIAPAGKYYGFYYSKDDLPAAFQNAEETMIPVSDGEWEWTDGTDNGGITKRITDQWFYYEAWF